MKKLLCLFIALTTLANVSYASFPITEKNTVLTTANFEDPDNDDNDDNEPSLIVLILRGVLVLTVLGTALFFIIRTWWRGWEKRKWWARKLVPWAILIAIPILLLLGLLMTGSGMGG